MTDPSMRSTKPPAIDALGCCLRAMCDELQISHSGACKVLRGRGQGLPSATLDCAGRGGPAGQVVLEVVLIHLHPPRDGDGTNGPDASQAPVPCSSHARWPSFCDDGSDAVNSSAARQIRRKPVKAVVYDTYGSPDVLVLMEIDEPVVGDDQVLVRVRATSVNPADWHFMRGLPYLVRLINGLRKPSKATVLGSDIAGQVEAVGENVTRFRPGDEVFGRTRAAHRPDRRDVVGAGGCAEYACVSEDVLAPKPANLTFEQAAAVPLAALTALQALRDTGKVQPGQRVLINGASGGVGTFAVQIAKLLGAHVTGVCGTSNMEMVRSIGADQVIDYSQEDFTKSGHRYDLILDIGDRSLSSLRRALTPKGALVTIGGSAGRWINGLGRQNKLRLLSPFVSQRLQPFLTKWSQQDLHVLRELIEAGKVTPVIDRTYRLSEAPEAMRYLEGGHARGKIVITV